MKMHTALTIAGSDSSGGAGIQADLKNMTAHGVYGMSALTALTAQNTMGVTDILAVPPAFLAAQLDAVFTDIPPDAVKIGMVADAALIRVIAEKLLRRTSSSTPSWLRPAAHVSSARMLLRRSSHCSCRERPSSRRTSPRRRCSRIPQSPIERV